MKRHLGSVAGLVAIFFFKLPNESEEKEQEESEDKCHSVSLLITFTSSYSPVSMMLLTEAV